MLKTEGEWMALVFDGNSKPNASLNIALVSILTDERVYAIEGKACSKSGNDEQQWIKAAPHWKILEYNIVISTTEQTRRKPCCIREQTIGIAMVSKRDLDNVTFDWSCNIYA